MKNDSATQTLETTKKEKARRRKDAGSSIFGFLMALVMLSAMAFSTVKQYRVELDSAYDSLRSSMYSLRNLISFEGNLEDAFARLRDTETVMYAELAKPFFEYLGVSRETLNACQYNWDATSLYYYPDEGSVITTDHAEPFSLDKSQTRMLKTIGMLFQDEWVYNAVRLKDGWVFIKWLKYPNIYTVDFKRIAEAVPSDLCIYENATGEVLVSSSEVPYDFLDESRAVFDKERNSSATDGIQVGYLRGERPFSGVFFEKSRLMDRYSVFVYVPGSTILNDTLDKTLAVHALLIVIFSLIWFWSRSVRKKGLPLLNRKTCLRLGKKRCLNLPVLRQLPPLLLSGLLAAMIFTSYLPLITNYINHNVKMEDKLDAFIRELELNDEEWTKTESLYRDVLIGHMYMIDMFADFMGEDFTQEVLLDLAQRMNLSSVTIYDAEGVSTMSTDFYVGYKLSENPSDDEYILWNLLRNADTSMMGELPDKSGFYAASRRFFKVPGLIYVTLPDDSLVTMREQTDINTALLRINTETYAKMHAYASTPETLLWATAASTAARPIANTMPQTALMNRYCGSQVINGYEYYLNTMTDDNHILISAEKFDVFTAPIKRDMRIIIPEILLCSLFIICAACIYPYSGAPAEEEPAKPGLIRLFFREEGEISSEEQEIRMEIRRRCLDLLWFLCTLLVVFYFADMLFSPHPMADYLFSHQWQREPSIFSLTTIILSVLFLAVGMKALKSILKFLSSRMDSRAETFGDLILSIIQFLLTVIVVIYSLHELGVNTNVILTSAGVVSLIIGYGSQSIVSDLVSGIFLIMEDQVRIGEYIEIDGFLGKVEHIGLRTTRASYENRTKVISNSNMVGFDNLSRETTLVKWSIGLPQYVDLETAKSLILGSDRRFKEELGDDLVRGPVYQGMSKVQWGGQYELVFGTFCQIAAWENVQGGSLELTYKILKENNIKPISGNLLPL